MSNQQLNAPNRTSAGTKAAGASPHRLDQLLPAALLHPVDSHRLAYRLAHRLEHRRLRAAVTGMLPLLMDTRTWLTVGRQRRPVKLAAIGMCALLSLFLHRDRRPSRYD